MIYWTNLLTRCHSASCLLFLVLGSQKMNILRIGRDKSQSSYFTGRLTEPEYETEEGQGLATPPQARASPTRATRWCGPPGTPPTLPPSPIRACRYQNPKSSIRNPPPPKGRFRGQKVSVPAPCRDEEVPLEPSPPISTTISITVAASDDEEGVVLPRG